MQTVTEFSYLVKVSPDGIINVSIRYGQREWHRFAPAYEDEDLIGLIWDQHWLDVKQKHAVSKEVKVQLMCWENSQRDHLDWLDNQSATWQDRLRFWFAMGCIAMLSFLAWVLTR